MSSFLPQRHSPAYSAEVNHVMMVVKEEGQGQSLSSGNICISVFVLMWVCVSEEYDNEQADYRYHRAATSEP